MRGDQWRDDFGRLVAECRVCTDDAYPNPFNETPEEGHICEECEEKMTEIGEQITQAMTYSPRIR